MDLEVTIEVGGIKMISVSHYDGPMPSTRELMDKMNDIVKRIKEHKQ